MNDKVKNLEKEKSDLEHQVAEHQKKKPKFEEKVPEELIALRKRKSDL